MILWLYWSSSSLQISMIPAELFHWHILCGCTCRHCEEFTWWDGSRVPGFLCQGRNGRLHVLSSVGPVRVQWTKSIMAFSVLFPVSHVVCNILISFCMHIHPFSYSLHCVCMSPRGEKYCSGVFACLKSSRFDQVHILPSCYVLKFSIRRSGAT